MKEQSKGGRGWWQAPSESPVSPLRCPRVPHQEMSPPPPPPLLTLDNFTSESEVPENCPFVLTSPRSLEACRRAGVQVTTNNQSHEAPYVMHVPFSCTNTTTKQHFNDFRLYQYYPLSQYKSQYISNSSQISPLSWCLILVLIPRSTFRVCDLQPSIWCGRPLSPATSTELLKQADNIVAFIWRK